MESIFKGSDKIQALEVLAFPEAEVEKDKGGLSSFASFGTLKVLYLKHYNRFFLQINDWKYPLLRRLPIVSSSKSEMGSRSYLLPALNGFSYKLTLNSLSSASSLANFETILEKNTMFSYRGASDIYRKAESSPDDKLSRKSDKMTGPMEKISETFKHMAEKINIKTETLKTGTKNLTSTKKRINLKDIKTRNFKEVPSKLKKDFIKDQRKLYKDFSLKLKENPNMLGSRDYESLRGSKDSHVPSFYLSKEDIEDTILNFKDLASKGSFNLSMDRFDSVKSMPETLSGMTPSTLSNTTSTLESRDRLNQGQFMSLPKDKLTGLESDPHYQG